MPRQLWYTVVVDHNGKIGVSSFMGKTIAAVRRFALMTARRVIHIGQDHAKALRIAQQEKEKV